MMSESDDENVLYAPTGKNLNHQGKGLLGNGVKNVNDILNGPSENRRLKKTVGLCGAFLGLGLALAVVGPTLQDLRVHFNVSLPAVSYIFTGRSVGYLLGSILGGVTFEYFHPLLLIAVTLAMSGIGLLITPYCHQFMASVFAIAFVGVAMGALDTGANVVCLRMWGKKSAPFMQALHFSFALGAFIAPLLAGPFIGQVPLASPSVSMSTTSAPNTTHVTLSLAPEFTPNSTTPMTEYNITTAADSKKLQDVTAHAPSSSLSTTASTTTEMTSATDFESTTLSEATITTEIDVTELITTKNSKTPPPKSTAPTIVSVATTANPSAGINPNHNKHKTNGKHKKVHKRSIRSAGSQEDTAQRYVRNKDRQSRRLLGQQDKAEGQRDDDKLRFHADDNSDFLRSKRKVKHWRSRIMLSYDAEEIAQSKSRSRRAESKPVPGGPDGKPVPTESSGTDDKPVPAEGGGTDGTPAPTEGGGTDNQGGGADDSDFDHDDSDHDPKTKSKPDHKPKERFQDVYVIIAVFLLLMGFVFTYFFCTSPLQIKSSSGHYKEESKVTSKPSEKNFTNYILGLLFVFYFLYVGAEVGYGGFIYTFAVNDQTVKFTPSNATQLNSVFWGTFALGRGVSICIASVLSPLNMVLLDILGCIVSSLALAYEADTNATVLWIGTATLGASMASLFPAGISWLESHAPVTGSMASFLIVGAAVGEMAVPLLLGNLFTSDIGPMSLMYIMFVISVLTAVIFGATVYLAHNEGRNYDPLRKEDILDDIITGVQSAIETEDIPFQTFGSKQSTKPFLPKPLQKKKHKE